MKFYIIAVLLASANAIHLTADPAAAPAKGAKDGESKDKLPNMGRA